jgi:tetratricopeptide (TPR) repeat protein
MRNLSLCWDKVSLPNLNPFREPESCCSPNLFPPPGSRLQAGAEPVAGYRLVARLGKGGSGEVWKARGPGGFPVALKFIPLADAEAAVELRSLELLRDIRHANLVTVFGTWQSHGSLVVAMELADRSLWDRYREAVSAGSPGIPKLELIEYLGEAAKALDYLNEPRHCLLGRQRVGVQHRDIKPHNLLLIGGSVKVADFGLAQVIGDQTPTETVHATPAYAGPECFYGRTSSRSDQYSLAVTYCQLRGGRLPFSGGVWEVMLGHSLDAPDLAMLPEEEKPIVARALAKDPAERWLNCRTFIRELAQSSRGEGRCGIASLPQPRTRPTDRRTSVVALMALAGFLVCTGSPENPPDRKRVSAHAEAKTASPRWDQSVGSESPPAVTRDQVKDKLPKEVVAVAEKSGNNVGPLPEASPVEPALTSPCPARGEGGPAEGDHDRTNDDLAAARLRSKAALVYYEWGKALAQKGDHEGAIPDFCEALGLDPQCAHAYVERGHAYVWKGDYDRAIADYTEALRLDSSSDEVCYGLGLAYYNRGAYAQAIASYTEALRLKPEFACALNGRGLAYVAQREPDRAIADFTAALQAAPHYAEAYNNRGCVYCQQGNWNQAVADFTRAVQLDGKNSSYRRNRTLASDRKGRSILITGIPAVSGAPSLAASTQRGK